MSENLKLPTWFWVFVAMALIWNLLGVIVFINQMMVTPEILTKLSLEEQALYASTPVWANIAFGFAVIGGALGCIALLLKRLISFYLFILSLLGVLVQMYHSFFISNSLEVYGPASVVMPMMIIVIAILLIWFAKYSQSKQWIS